METEVHLPCSEDIAIELILTPNKFTQNLPNLLLQDAF
jgi:hypothetical protein